MILTKLIFASIISIVLSITISKVNPEFKLYITVLFGLVVICFLFGEIKENITEFVGLFSKYDIKIDNFKILLKIVFIAYICDFISMICKDLNHESIGKKVEIAGKMTILIYSVDVIRLFLDQVLLLVNR